MKTKIDFEQMRNIVYKAGGYDDIKIHYSKAIWGYTRACRVMKSDEENKIWLRPFYGRLTDTPSSIAIYGDNLSDIIIEGDEIKFKEDNYGRKQNCIIKLIQEKTIPIEEFV